SRTTSGQIHVLLGNGDGTFQQPTSYAVGSVPGPISVADLNGDQQEDLLVINERQGDGSLSLLLGNGDGTFQSARTLDPGPKSGALAIGDFNDDGLPDIAEGVGSGVRVLLGNGDGTFRAEYRSYGATAFVADVVVADFNGDQAPDLMFSRGLASRSVG